MSVHQQKYWIPIVICIVCLGKVANVAMLTRYLKHFNISKDFTCTSRRPHMLQINHRYSGAQDFSHVLPEWPVALTRIIIMKCFLRLVQQHLTPPPVCLLLHRALSHLERWNTYVRTLFTDFSSAFNTVLPQHLSMKMRQLCLTSTYSAPTKRPCPYHFSITRCEPLSYSQIFPLKLIFFTIPPE